MRYKLWVALKYKPVSLLPIFGKIIEKLIFDSTMLFLEENKLLNSFMTQVAIIQKAVH